MKKEQINLKERQPETSKEGRIWDEPKKVTQWSVWSKGAQFFFRSERAANRFDEYNNERDPNNLYANIHEITYHQC